MKNILISVFTLLIAFLITGCADEPQKVVLPQQTANPSAGQKLPDSSTASPAKETAIVATGYEYNPHARRDPFTSLIVKQEIADKKKGATPLERDELTALRLTAIVWSGSQHYALITLPDGKSYTVRKGMKLGLDGGIVEDITKDTVVVRQYLKDKKGTLKPKDLILRLRMEEQG